MADRIYADHNATSPILPELNERVLAQLDGPTANASSPHALGRQARERIEHARSGVAALAGCAAEHVVFTATATEANAIALQGRTIVISGIEHPSVTANARRLEERGASVRVVPPEQDGVVSETAIEHALAGADLCALMWANNETGVVQPVEEVARLCRARGVRLHVDAVQALGKLPVTLARADTYAISAHKLGGLPGAAALIVRGEPPPPLWRAGGHERGVRGGTESLLAIEAFGWAAAVWKERGDVFRANMQSARDAFEAALRGFQHAVIGVDRVPNTSNILVPGVRGEALLSALDLAGVAASHGSACATGSLDPSPVLLAMGISEGEARTALRVSFGPHARAAEGAEVASRLIACAERLRAAVAP